MAERRAGSAPGDYQGAKKCQFIFRANDGELKRHHISLGQQFQTPSFRAMVIKREQDLDHGRHGPRNHLYV